MSRLFGDGASDHRVVVDSCPLSSSAGPFSAFAWYRPTQQVPTDGNSRAATSIVASGSTAQYADIGTISTGAASIRIRNTTQYEAVTTNLVDEAAWNAIGGEWASTTSRTVRLARLADTSIDSASDTNTHTAFTPNRTCIGAMQRSNGTIIEAQGAVAHTAWWNVVLTTGEWEKLLLGRVSPLMVRPASLVFYTPYLGRDASEIDIIGGRILTVTGATVSAEEPPILWLPGKKRIFFVSSGITLIIANASHGHSVDNLVLTQANNLVIADALHSHAVDNLVLTQANTLVVAEALHAHSVDNVALTQANVLALQDTLHGHTAESLALTQANLLVVQEALHAHNSDSIALTQANLLAIADCLHSHVVDSLLLSGAGFLAVQDALHAHTVGNVSLTQANVLVIADALHAHTVDLLALVQANSLVVADSSHGHSADNLTLSSVGQLVIQDALHSHTVDNVVLSESATLAIQDALHGHTADLIGLIIYTFSLPPTERRLYWEAVVRAIHFESESRRLTIDP